MDRDDRALYEEIRDIVGHGNMSKFMIRAMRLYASFGPYSIYELVSKNLEDMNTDELEHLETVKDAITETYRNHMKRIMDVKEPIEGLNQFDGRS